MSGASVKRCVVAYATAQRQFLWTVDLPAEASIADAVAAARRQAQRHDLPWDSAAVGIFGEIRDRTDIPDDGDRIELYRALRQDPKDKRRSRVKTK